ncbi:glycosyltransferase [Balneolaceae bacterium ANBcel3]|nr:glycosyltransferase [Balneolaceae bacterium ANBcel3]
MQHEPGQISCILPASINHAQTARSILCFQNQTWFNKVLILVQGGNEDLSPLLEDLHPGMYEHHKTKIEPGDTISLLNYGLQKARGQFVALFNENEWSHSERLEKQAQVLSDGCDMCWFGSTLYHLDHPEHFHQPYVHAPIGGYAPGIMFKNNPAFFFSDRKRNPYRHFLSLWKEHLYKRLDHSYASYLIRHMKVQPKSKALRMFYSGLRKTPVNLFWYTLLKSTGKNLSYHPQFRLTQKEKEHVQMYLRETQALGLFDTAS